MIELKNCIKWLKKNKFKKVSLQISDDNLEDSLKIVNFLQKNSNSSFFMIGNTVYEKCCSDMLSADHIEANACIHIGHACLSSIDDLPIFHIFPKQEIDVRAFCETFSNYFQDKNKNILFYYDLALYHVIDVIYETLRQKYKNFIVSELNSNIHLPSQVEAKNNLNFSIIGRISYIPKNWENYVIFFLGSNNRTLQILALNEPIKEWYYYDESKILEFNVLHFSWLKKKNYLKEKIKDAERFGLIIASLNIGEYLKIMETTKNILKKMSKKTYIFSVGKITPSKLANFQEVDIFVVISCPESSLIDGQDYYKPIVTPYDIELAFSDERKNLIPYSIDFKQMLPGGPNYKEFKNSFRNDVSLINGKVRNYEREHHSKKDTLGNQNYKICNSEVQINKFQMTQWDGLKRESDEKKINLIEQGRDGIPVKYANESSFKK